MLLSITIPMRLSEAGAPAHPAVIVEQGQVWLEGFSGGLCVHWGSQGGGWPQPGHPKAESPGRPARAGPGGGLDLRALVRFQPRSLALPSPAPRPYTSLCLHRSHSLIVCFERAPRLAVAGVGPAVFQVLTRLPNGPAGSLPGSAALAASLRHRWGNRPSSLHWDFYATVDLPLSVGDFLLYKNPAAASPARSFTLTGTTHTDTLVMRQILAPVCHRPLL